MISVALFVFLGLRLMFSVARAPLGPRPRFARNVASLIADAIAFCLFALSSAA